MNSTTSNQDRLLTERSGAPSSPSPVPIAGTGRSPRRPSRYRGTVVATLFLLLLCTLLLLGGLASTQGWGGFSPGATITITPKYASFAQSISVTAAIGTPGQGLAQARWLLATPPAERATVPATGSKHQDTQPGRGQVTYFNQATYAIDIPTGITLTGRDGVQVVTDAPAHVPAGDPGNYYGSYDVPAHAVNPGPSGNIAAGDIDMLCCANGIVAKNMHAFSGGQTARTFTVVQQTDISNASSPLVASLTRRGQTDLKAQAGPGELFTPPHCTQNVQVDHAVGQEAAQVTVTETVTCSSEAYERQQVDSLAATSFQQRVTATLSPHYQLSGQLTTAPGQATPIDAKGTLSIPVATRGLWVYQVDQQALHDAIRHLLGKQQQAARTQIVNLPGVGQVTIDINGGGNTLPDVLDQITLVMAAPHTGTP